MSSCLICGGVPATESARPGMERISLLHKILKIPVSTCWSWLEEEDGLSFCGGCNTLVDQGLGLVRLLEGLEAELKGVQFKLGTLLLRQDDLEQEEAGQSQGSSLRAKVKAQMEGGSLTWNEIEEAVAGIGIITERRSVSSSYQEEDDDQNSDVDGYSQQLSDPLGEESEEYGSQEEGGDDLVCKVDPWSVNPDLEEDSVEPGNVFYIEDDENMEDFEKENETKHVPNAFLPLYTEKPKVGLAPRILKLKGNEVTRTFSRKVQSPHRIREEILSASLKIVKIPKVKIKLSQVQTKKNSYICLLCGINCGNGRKTAEHYALSHPNTTEWRCFTCNQVFRRKMTLYCHTRNVHREVYKDVSSAGTSTKFKIRSKGKTVQKKVRNYKCVLCGVDCKSGPGVKSHYVRYHPTLPKNLECPTCARMFFCYNTFLHHEGSCRKGGAAQDKTKEPENDEKTEDYAEDYDSDASYSPGDVV